MKRRILGSKLFVWIVLGILSAFCCLEIFSRAVLGLGDPPLSIADAEIDYLFAPNQDCARFGNRICYNAASMRAERDVPPRRADARRVVVVGDSVVNGGVLTTHDDLATTRLDADLRRAYAGDCWNVSAGSWGPMNYAAYFRKFGTFDATDLVLEVNSHDLWEDDPKEGGGRIVGSLAFPDRKPVSACWEAFTRYALPKIKGLAGRKFNRKVDVPHCETEARNALAKKNLDACAFLYSLPFARKFLVVHRSRAECARRAATPGETAFVEHARAHGVQVVYLTLDPQEDYRDDIHPNANGQRKFHLLLKMSLGF